MQTLRALDEISVQANRDPRPAYEAFAKAVHRLEVDSIKVRARTQAMRARGDAYFEHWEEYLAGVKNEQVRQLAEEHRPRVEAELRAGPPGIPASPRGVPALPVRPAEAARRPGSRPQPGAH